ncbi:RNA polymerase sigma factor [Sporosarcina saromensis]|uniref:RNA polymerase sigma factor n=1 Tax=Sporosarcina saromensis TaxID=359365 RepID=A0ABU4G6W3_9BACL|nr:RNA polymerase sigma factor [Sporosarcina saromensis]MDW0112713.1 RNA polymerase sigma factor [Sporosarcina saromensis]
MDKEQRWIKQIQTNASESAANALVSKYYKEIYAFCFKQTLNQDLSLDLTQEIFISTLQSIHTYDKKRASFRTWLYRLAANKIVDYYRSKTYRYTQFSQPIEDREIVDEHDLVLSLEYKEDVEQVNAIVNNLESSSQQIMRLKLFGDYTLKEIAEMESIPVSTVKTRYYAALRKIRKEMEV